VILVALGANLPGPAGTPAQALAAACRSMAAKGIAVTESSRIWLSAPIPASDQPWYSNAVVRVETKLRADRLMAALKNIETAFGRVRIKKNEARVLDLDLVACNGGIFESPDLVLPHPRLHQRAFVLMPLREVAPDWVHPVLNRSVDDLIAALPPGQEIKPGEALL
jgi:2-amino-4-hydroxy-6-hydroxymethyldihydropteridine diphosphokinase